MEKTQRRWNRMISLLNYRICTRLSKGICNYLVVDKDFQTKNLHRQYSRGKTSPTPPDYLLKMEESVEVAKLELKTRFIFIWI